jgi:hypothetical protein
MRNKRDDEQSPSEEGCLLDEGTEMEKMLLQSSELDEGSEIAQRRVLAAVRKADDAEQETSLGSHPAFLALGLAAAGLLAFYVSNRGAEPSSVVASAEGEEASEQAPAGSVAPKAASEETPLKLGEDPCLKAGKATGESPRIDLITEQKVDSREAEGRFGTWFVDNDGTGIQKPASIDLWKVESLAPATPSFALHTSGSAFSKWGATVGVNLAGGGCYDASVYDGVVIEARGPARVSLLVQTMDVVPVSEGGTCERGCYASHFKKVQLSGKFERHEVRFDELTQHKFGSKVAFDRARLRSVIFQVAPEDSPFDFAISEVSFLKASKEESAQ